MGIQKLAIMPTLPTLYICEKTRMVGAVRVDDIKGLSFCRQIFDEIWGRGEAQLKS